MWCLALVACELIVDFDPSTTGSTAQTGDTGRPPVPGPSIVQGTACDGFVPVLDTPNASIDTEFTPLSGPVTFADEDLESLVFGVDTSVVVTVGDVPGPQVEPPTEGGTVVFAILDGGQLLVVSFCALPDCTDRTIRITLPAAVDRVVGEAARGDVTVADAAITDVYVGTSEGDVRVSGDASGIRAAALDGSVTVDAPSAQIVDLHTSTGALTMTGSATSELCAISDLGDLDVTVQASERVSLQATNGSIDADLVSRPRQLDLSLVVGGAEVRLPGGAYDIDLVSIPETGLILDGIVHDASASDQIVGSSLGTGTRLSAR
ncbi:MAG: DUF4097 family beta strand repeat-containing protein [Myxococcota bacterium]